MEATTTIEEVRTFDTRGGNTRYVMRDADGNQYTTFREAAGNKAKALEGQRVWIGYHEEQRGQYNNVYLDKVQPAAAPEGEDRVASDIKESDEDG